MKRIPIGERTFSELIKSETLYIDKTEHLYNLIKHRGRYFLSRPRRFGKSLTCSTLKAIFSGNKELFKDLWIGKSDYDWQVRPVIYFDFSGITYETPDQLVEDLHKTLDEHAEQYGIVLKETSLKRKFTELVKTLGQTINSVAIIIDEYDKPITSHIDNPEIADSLRKKLAEFYGTLKTDDIDENLYFLFVTGVTKFSLFSEFNILSDLTNHDRAADIVGYTDKEVDLYFHEHIKALSSELNKSYQVTRATLKTWYNGYRFSRKDITVYNPFSLHNCLDQKRISNFWFISGTPNFLMKFISKNPDIANDIETVENSFLSESSMDKLTIDLYYQNYKTLLLQTGYLTFASGYDEGKRGNLVKYPNEEVRYSMTEQIMEFVGEVSPEKFGEFGDRFRKALRDDNLELFCKHLQDFLKLIPHNIRVEREKFYHQTFFMICRLFGNPRPTDLAAEVPTETGFMDLLLEGTKNIFIVEFKLKGTPEAALAQIEEKRYWEAYEILKTKKVVLAGITFNEKSDGIVVLCKTKDL